MNRILATTAILALSAGFASAEVTLSGDARMGIIGGDGVDTAFTSRARVKFSMSGTTDGGLEFGASFRAADAGGAASGTAGEVHISGAFGKLSMGDVDHGDKAAVGNISGVGLTGLGDLNEVDYDNSNTILPRAAYEYSAGSLSFYLSVGLEGGGAQDSYGAGVKYSADAYTFALGYGRDNDSDTQLSASASATMGAATIKGIYSHYESDGGFLIYDQLGVSVDYVAGAATITGFYMDDELSADPSYGLGVAYDLGGGASVVGGYVDNGGASAFDLGLSFSF